MLDLMRLYCSPSSFSIKDHQTCSSDLSAILLLHEMLSAYHHFCFCLRCSVLWFSALPYGEDQNGSSLCRSFLNEISASMPDCKSDQGVRYDMCSVTFQSLLACVA